MKIKDFNFVKGNILNAIALSNNVMSKHEIDCYIDEITKRIYNGLVEQNMYLHKTLTCNENEPENSVQEKYGVVALQKLCDTFKERYQSYKILRGHTHTAKAWKRAWLDIRRELKKMGESFS